MIIEALLAPAPAPIPLTAGGYTFRMVPVQGGIFDMGDEDLWESCRPVHRVRLNDFCIGQFPVTQALWRAVSLNPGPSPEERGDALDPDPSFFKGDHRPVEQVSWEEVQVFLKKLNQLLPGWNFRLPTEAEWEYAARGGLTPALSKGEGDVVFSLSFGEGRGEAYSGSDRLESVGWYGENSNDETKPVGLKLPNAQGLFDMIGNVREWCADLFDEKYYQKYAEESPVLNPRNDEEGWARVLRGGSWIHDVQQYCRLAARGNYDPPGSGGIIGFRLAASPSGSVAGP